MLKEEQRDSEVRYKNPHQYERYVTKHFECMRADGYQVKISERLYYRATKDRKIEQWLEDNLTMLPYCMKSLSDLVLVTGGHIVSCICHMNNYNNISTEICATDRFSQGRRSEARTVNRSVIRTTTVSEIEEQVRYNSIFWTPEAESAGFKAKA